LLDVILELLSTGFVRDTVTVVFGIVNVYGTAFE
jgi:hypothetical protein